MNYLLIYIFIKIMENITPQNKDFEMKLEE